MNQFGGVQVYGQKVFIRLKIIPNLHSDWKEVAFCFQF